MPNSGNESNPRFIRWDVTELQNQMEQMQLKDIDPDKVILNVPLSIFTRIKTIRLDIVQHMGEGGEVVKVREVKCRARVRLISC